MNWYAKTKYADLEQVCRQRYGGEKGARIYRRAQALFETLMAEADDRGSAAVRRHMTENLFPVLAYYLALLKEGDQRETAYRAVLEETQKHARLAREQNARLARLPFLYSLFRWCGPAVMKRKFPPEGWDTQWVRRGRQEIHFNMGRCVYQEITAQYGVPELCAAFCANDVTAFSGYLPRIRFERAGTIAEGAEVCDFHFYRGSGR